MYYIQSKKAFTLIELSIVLVIIGLIVGAIMTGQSLMRRSKVNSIALDAQTYITAINNFKQKYGALPGDMANATTIWGAAVTSSSDNYTASCYGHGSQGNPATCNGDGNGMIGPNFPIGSDMSSANEIFGIWQQLADAQFIAGQYSNVAGAGGYLNAAPGINVPAGRIDGSGYSIGYFGVVPSNTGTLYAANYGHALNMGLASSTVGPDMPVLTAAETYNLDNKYDDGLPASGSIMTQNTTLLPNCNTTSTPPLYATSTLGMACSVLFITGF